MRERDGRLSGEARHRRCPLFAGRPFTLLRILYFHQHFSTPQGSTGTRSYEFARALVARGHAVTMVCGSFSLSGLDLKTDPKRGWARGNIDGIDVIALPLPYSNKDGLARRTWLFVRFAWQSARIALHEKADLLFATSTPLTAGIPGIVSKFLRRDVPFVFEVRDLWPELPRALGMRNPVLLGGMSVLEWLSYRCADACVGLSPGIAEGIRRRGPKNQPIEMIPNGCDLDLFSPGNRSDLRLEGIAPGDFVAAFTGAHGVANGLDAVLEAAAEVLRRGRPDIKLVFIGDGREKPRLEAAARSRGLPNCLFFPPVKKRQLAEMTGCFDCGLMVLANVPAFYFGTSPNKFFDYLAAGIPILNNYPGWLADQIAAEECGVVVPPDDSAAFAMALIRLADSPLEQRRAMGRRARALAEREYSRSTLSEQFIAFLERTVKS